MRIAGQPVNKTYDLPKSYIFRPTIRTLFNGINPTPSPHKDTHFHTNRLRNNHIFIFISHLKHQNAATRR